MRRLFYCLFLTLHAALCTPHARAAGFSGASAGTSSGQFLKIPADARGAALGEAYSALADNAFALDWNPAGILAVENDSLVFMHAPYLAGTFMDYFAYAQNAGEVGSWGAALKYFNYGAIRKTDSSGSGLGDLTPYEMSVSVGFATYISGYKKEPEERCILGAAGKFVRSKLGDSDNTISADIGLLFPYLIDNRLRLALTAQNIMGSLRYDKEDAPLPLIVRLGSAIEVSEYILLTIDAAAPKDNLPYLAMGTEIKVGFSNAVDTALRAGFNTRGISDVTGFSNASFGAGLRYDEYFLDYSFSPFGSLGSAHRISAGWNF